MGFAEKEGFKFTTVWVANALVYRLIGHYRRLKSRKPMIFVNMTRVICRIVLISGCKRRTDRVTVVKLGSGLVRLLLLRLPISEWNSRGFTIKYLLNQRRPLAFHEDFNVPKSYENFVCFYDFPLGEFLYRLKQ